MIWVIEYRYLNITIAHHQSQSQKHWFLIEKPSENRVSTKPVEKTVIFVMHT